MRYLYIKIQVSVLTTRNKSNFENIEVVAIVSWLAKHLAVFFTHPVSKIVFSLLMHAATASRGLL